MTFLFAYLGSLNRPPGWPIHLMYVTEAALVFVTFACVLLAKHVRDRGTQPERYLVAVAGGIGASFGLIMPFELAPFFFGASGESMLASVLLNLVYPPAAILFIYLFLKSVNAEESPPDVGADLLGATRCYDRGVAFLDGKDYDRAIADFTDAVRHNPKYAAAYYNRGFAYLENKDYDRAIADYDRVIALNPKLASAYRNRGNAYRAKGELDRATADFDQAHALMREGELRARPEREVVGTGVMRVLSQWMNNRG
jgi:tetratricopeptide (TPR) repeat protein